MCGITLNSRIRFAFQSIVESIKLNNMIFKFLIIFSDWFDNNRVIHFEFTTSSITNNNMILYKIVYVPKTEHLNYTVFKFIPHWCRVIIQPRLPAFS